MRAIEPERALVPGDDAGSMSWAFVLEPVDEGSTRLITPSRGACDRLALRLMLKVVWHPVHFEMQRRQVLNLKRGWRWRPDGARQGAWMRVNLAASLMLIPMATGSRLQSLPWRGQKGRLPLLAAALALAVGYWFPVRRWMSRWGTTPDERAREMPGDGLIANPTHSAMQAVTVKAPPADIWPWLVQIGCQRGGLYSYDWLDRLFGFLDRPSATRILPEFQQLAVGDKILWRPAGTLSGRVELTVAVLEPLRALALSYQGLGMEWVWQFGLYPLDSERTRLVTRGIERVPKTAAGWLGMRIMEPASFVMTARMLLNLKERAEALRASAS